MHENDLAAARSLVIREGWLLDKRDWRNWLDLYLEDCEYWLPCWKDEYTTTNNPQGEISLIYYSSRAGLEDRVYRIETDRSLASIPLPRTTHIISIADISEADGNTIQVESNWSTYSYKHDQTHCFFGMQTHLLASTADGLKIYKRKIIVMNDRIPSVLDIYSV